MSEIYIKVGEFENDPDTIELPIEKDDTIPLSSVTAQFPGVCGLKYRNPSSQTMRGLKLVDGVLYLPSQNKEWEKYVYIVVTPKDNKRKMEDEDSSNRRSKRPNQKCTDLIVLGLPWKITEEGLKSYFSDFGELTVTMIKRDSTGKSRGYGFIRYANYESQENVLSKRHMIEGRACDVKIPHSQEDTFMTAKVFVGRISETITKDDLQKHFEQFGEVLDVYIPTPFRAFAFVTFKDSNVAQSLIGEDQIINGASVYISTANPKNNKESSNNGGVSNTQLPTLNYNYSNQNFNPAAASFSPPRGGHHNNNDVGPTTNNPPPNYNNMMNPAMLAAAWNFMGMFGGGNQVDPINALHQNKNNSGRGDWNQASSNGGGRWNFK